MIRLCLGEGHLNRKRLSDYGPGAAYLAYFFMVISLCATTDRCHESQYKTSNYRKKKLNPECFSSL